MKEIMSIAKYYFQLCKLKLTLPKSIFFTLIQNYWKFRMRSWLGNRETTYFSFENCTRNGKPVRQGNMGQ